MPGDRAVMDEICFVGCHGHLTLQDHDSVIEVVVFQGGGRPVQLSQG